MAHDHPIKDRIKDHMDVIGADGVHVGTVDHVKGAPDGSWRIQLTKTHSGPHGDHHHFIPLALVADVEGDTVRLSANGDVAVTFEEEK